MKAGKVKLRTILSKETGIPVRDIIHYGRYECFGNRETLEVGAHTIIALSGQLKIVEPVYVEDEITYRTRML